MAFEDLIFWNVDTTKDFMINGGELYVTDAELILPNLANLTQYAKEKNIKVVNTADWHTKDSEEISENPNWVTTFPLHCPKYGLGAEFVPETSIESLVSTPSKLIAETTLSFEDTVHVTTTSPVPATGLSILNTA